MASLSNLKQCPQFSSPGRAGQHLNYNPGLEHYPLINLKNELSCTTSQRFTVGQSFIPVESESVPKRISRAFFDGGFWESLEEARSQKTREQAPLIGKTAEQLAQLLQLYKTLKLKVFPHTQELSAERIAHYAETRDWINSPIRCTAWHCHLFKLAVAGVDDVVRIYMKRNENSGMIPPPVLKSPSQSEITCMAWRPFCVFELVVGCRQGLCFWTIDNNLHLGRTMNPSLILKHPNNLPITTLQWNKNGTQLATASIGDRAILIWEPDMGKFKALRRLGPPGSLFKWSPGNEWMFASTVDRVFRVWKCHDKWSTDRWVCNQGNVQAACWSPCGRFLLFASTSEPILYRLQFVKLHLGDSDDREVLPVVDLNAIMLDSTNQTLIGGTVQQLAWDPNGKYLVVSFKTTNSIAIFRTYIQKFSLQISGGYYMLGETPSEYPSYVCFQPLNRENQRSVLTIGWSSGRIQFHAFD